MRKTKLGLLLAAAFIAMLALGMTSCDEGLGAGPSTYEGEIVITAWKYADGELFAGKPITVEYQGTESFADMKVTVNKGGSGFEEGVDMETKTNTKGTYTLAAGEYWVTVGGSQSYDLKELKFTVKEAPDYIDFLGKWSEDADLPHVQTTGASAGESIVITAKTFRIEDFAGIWGEFDIEWGEKITANFPAGTFTGQADFKVGFPLTFKRSDDGSDYSSFEDKTLNFYINDMKNTVVREATSGTIAKYSNDAREYELQED